MNSFETPNFKFFTYDFNNKLDVEFIKELIEDEDTDRYLKSIVAFINKDSFNPLKTAYLVSNNDNIVGYLNLYEDNRIVELDLAVGPKHRGIKNNSNETIGCQILKEALSYLEIEKDDISNEWVKNMIILFKIDNFTIQKKYLSI